MRENIIIYKYLLRFLIIMIPGVVLQNGCKSTHSKQIQTKSILPDLGQPLTRIDSCYFNHHLFCAIDTTGLSTYETYRYNELLALRHKSCGPTDSIPYLELKITRAKDSLYYYLNQNTRFDTIDLPLFHTFIDALIESLGPDHYWLAKCYWALGNQYYYLYADIYRSYDYYKKALAIYQGLSWVGHEQVYLLSEMVQKTIAHREYLQGKSYGLEAVHLASSYFPLDSILNALSQSKTGLIKMLIGEEDCSEYFDEALDLISYGPYHALNQEILKYSIFYGEADDSIRQKVIRKLNLAVSEYGDFVNLHKTLAEEKMNSDHFYESIPHSLLALNWLEGKKGVDPGLQLTIYYNLILAYMNTGQYQNARSYSIAEAIRSHIYLDKNISYWIQKLISGDYNYEAYSFISYAKIAQTYFLEFPDSADSLKLALQFVKLGEEQLVNECNSIEENRRIWLVGYSKDLFKIGVHVAFRLYRLTKEDQYLSDFIRYTEQMKAIILEGDSDKFINHFIQVDSIIQYDKLVRSKLRIFRQTHGNTDSLNHYLNLVSQLNDYYKAEYPEYLAHRIFGQVHTDYVIPKDVCLIGYDLIDSFLYIQTHTHSDVNLYRICMNDPTLEQLERLTKYQRDQSPSWDSLVFFSEEIGEILWPEIPEDIDKVIISSSGEIGALSFSALRTMVQDTSKWVSDIYRIQFVPGLRFVDSLFWETTPIGMDSLAAFAFSNPKTIMKSKFDVLELPGSYFECSTVKKLFPTTGLYDGYRASKSNFLKTYQDPAIRNLHIAVHGVSVSDKLDEVYLLFRKGRSKLDTLYGYELLEFQSNTRQVFLTSCFTQSGYQVEGEGLYNLARYFLSNGANRVVTSMWAMDDQMVSNHVEYLLTEPDIYKYVQSIKAMNAAPYYWAGIMDVRM